jgi:hypothetical protein
MFAVHSFSWQLFAVMSRTPLEKKEMAKNV